MTGARSFRRRTLLGLVGLLVGSVLLVMAAPNLGAATVEGHPDGDEPKTEKPTTSEKPDKPTTTTTVKPTTTTTVKPTTTTTVKPTTTTTVKPTTTTTVKPTTTTTVKP
ncbi:MAG TPA: hypothetical protein VFP06_16985, partial [Acidimicrobiales bacterium]|nr:hypothetical protein [Acidimicrobiales bacterium]